MFDPTKLLKLLKGEAMASNYIIAEEGEDPENGTFIDFNDEDNRNDFANDHGLVEGDIVIVYELVEEAKYRARTQIYLDEI